MPRRRIWRLNRDDGDTALVIEGEVIVGRGDAADLRIQETMISRRHARLWLDGNGAMVEDLGSTNGTYLNDRRLRAPMPLVPGDRLRFDETQFVVAAAFEDAAARAERDSLASSVIPIEGAATDTGPFAAPPASDSTDEERTYVAPLEESFDLGANDFEIEEDGDDGEPDAR